MKSALRTVNCTNHGMQQKTLVCQHIVQGLVAKERVGFFWAIDDQTNPRPDAYCTACNERAKATGGEWIGEALRQLEPKVLCGLCYDLAKKFHMGGNPWS